MFGVRRRKPVVPDDTGQAHAISQEAKNELREVRMQNMEVESMLRKLERRRQQNHFGEEITISWTPRKGHT